MNKLHSFFSSYKGYLTLGAGLLLSSVLSLLFGSASLSFAQLFTGLFGDDKELSIIIYNIRLVRTVAAIIAGVGLSVSGVMLQSVTRNSLASPSVIGVNSGAGVFVAISLLLPFPTIAAQLALTPLFAFCGALFTTLAVISIAHFVGGKGVSVILSGIAINAFFNAIISLINLTDSDVLVSYNAFSVGGFSGVTYTALFAPFGIVAVCLTLSLLLSRKIDTLAIGVNGSTTLGVNAQRLSVYCILIASASAAAVVSFAGLLGFVGLIVPHMARYLCGAKSRSLIICSSLLGGIVTVLADLFGRTVLAPSELPVGITMAFVGVPFFIFLLFKQRRESL